MNDTPDMPAAEALNPRARATDPWGEERATALLVLADGTIIEGKGAGATGTAVGEVCFNTSMTGYQEILPTLLCRRFITFTFPLIGDLGADMRGYRDRPMGRMGASAAVRPRTRRAGRRLPVGDRQFR